MILTDTEMSGFWNNTTTSTGRDHTSGTTASMGRDHTSGTTASMDMENDDGLIAAINTGNSIAIVLYIVAFILNVFGNTTIIVAVSKYPWLKHNMYVALQSLAVADLLVAVTILVESVRLYNLSIFQGFLFIVIDYLQLFFILGACYHVVLVALERFVAIMFPFQYTTYVTPKLIWVSSAFTYLFVLLLSLPSFVLNIENFVNIKHSNYALYVAGSFSSIFNYVLLAILLLFLHGKVTITAKQQRRRVEGTNGNKGRHHGVERATKMMVIIVGVYLLLWAPLIVTTIVALILKESNAVLYFVQTFALVLGSYNSSVNFVIYTAFNRKLRMAFKKVLKLDKQADEIEESAIQK